MSGRFDVENPVDFGRMAQEMRRSAEQALLKQVELEKTELIVRTLSGEDADGRPFNDLSPKYKEAKGRFVNNLGSSWLQLTGHMLSSLTTKTEQHGEGIFVAMIYPINSEKPSIRLPGMRKSKKDLKPLKAVSAADKVRWNDAIRPFFRWSEIQIERLQRAVIDSFRNL